MSKKTKIINLKNQIFENNINLKIYDIINKHLKNSFKYYPIENNLIAVYSIHLLKFITALFLKNNELKYNNLIDEFRNSKFKTFPYISYNEIYDKTIDDNKKFGINSSRKIRQIIKSYFFIHNNYRQNKLTSSLNALSIKNYKFLNQFTKVNYLNFIEKYSYQEINNQLLFFDKIIEEIFDTIELPFSPKDVFTIFKNHILANSIESKPKNLILGDFVLLTSGNDTINRHIASNAKKFKKEVIILDHAYYTGYADDINLGMGEQLFSDTFITFGNFYKNNKHMYRYSNFYQNKILSSSSKKIENIKKNKFIEFNIKNIYKFYYIPTSLRGATYRFGPFMDIADHTYLKWQKNLIDIFNKSLVFKHHPKDKFIHIYKSYLSNVETSYQSIRELISLNLNICFIFDTIGTAFAEVSASKYPIIFFDLHQRNLPDFFIEKIKERCLYIDINQIEELSKKDIKDLLINKEFNYNALDSFSIENANSSKDQIDVLRKYLFNKK